MKSESEYTSNTGDRPLNRFHQKMILCADCFEMKHLTHTHTRTGGLALNFELGRVGVGLEGGGPNQTRRDHEVYSEEGLHHSLNNP